MVNPWRATPSTFPFVLKDDEPFVRAHNENCSVRSPHQIDLRLPPQPFAGRLNAPVVVLLANPGKSAYDFRQQSSGPNLETIMRAIQSPRGTPFWPLTPQFEKTKAGEWWRRRTRELSNVFSEEGGEGFVAERFMSIELHGYHSKEWTSPLRNFPSQIHGFGLVEQAMDRGALIMIARCQRHWYESVPGLRQYRPKILHLNSQRSAYISKGNLGGRNFAIVVRALRDGRGST
jgi:hypothetical protein